MSADHVPPRTPAGTAHGAPFGDQLRRSRVAQGLALADVAKRTRIAVHHLEALERSDLGALPPGPFAKSYVRAYAEVLGIDPEPVLDACRVEERRRGADTPEGERRLLEELSQLVGSGAAGRRARLQATPARLAVATVSAVVLATGGWLLARQGSRESPAESPAPPATAPSRPAPAPPRPTPVPPAGVTAPSPTPPAARPAGATRPRANDDGAAAARTPSPPTESLEVSEFGVGTDVVARRLVGRGDRFPGGTRVVFWTQVLGGRPGHVIHHVWFQEGRAVMRANLEVRGPHWRTHSAIVLPTEAAGGWTVEARTSDGRLLARHDFVCEPRAPR